MPSSRKQKSSARHQDASYTTLYMTIYAFRGQPDFYFKRHVLIYFQSAEDSSFHETVHAVRDGVKGPWKVDRLHTKINWALTARYIFHCDGGALLVPKGQEMVPVNIMAAIPVDNRENDWTCQNFLLEGLGELVAAGYQTQEWYSAVEDTLMGGLVDGTVG